MSNQTNQLHITIFEPWICKQCTQNLQVAGLAPLANQRTEKSMDGDCRNMKHRNVIPISILWAYAMQTLFSSSGRSAITPRTVDAQPSKKYTSCTGNVYECPCWALVFLVWLLKKMDVIEKLIMVNKFGEWWYPLHKSVFQEIMIEALCWFKKINIF